MDLSAPKWLDQIFLENLLRDGENEDGSLKVVSFSVEPAVAPGNNYLSYMYRLRVEYETGQPVSKRTVSLMMKVPLSEGFMEGLSETHDFFGKEPRIYSELLPSLNKTALSEFGPKSFNCPVKNVVVMKDLKEEGYVLCEKAKQMDFAHSEVVVTKLAKFHAATVVSLNSNKKLVREFGVDTFFVDGSSIHKMAIEALKNVLKNITADESYARFEAFFLERYDRIWPTCSRLTKPKPTGGFNVLNHGDMWINNILFKYNKSGEISDVKFIDYQLSRIGSPANDLLYFIWTSTNEEVRGSRQKELFSIYLSTLNKTLADLGCEERLSEQELRDDISRSVDYVLVVFSLLADPEDIPDLTSLKDEEFETEKFHKLFKGKTFNRLFPNCIQQVTDFFVDGKGTLDKNDENRFFFKFGAKLQHTGICVGQLKVDCK